MMSSEMDVGPNSDSSLTSRARLTVPFTKRPKRRILRGRKIINPEQVMEQLKAEACNGAELSSSLELVEDANEISGREVERQELLRQSTGIREHQRLVSSESGIIAKVQDYLRSGGTPRPSTSAENTRSMPFASRGSVVKSGLRTPAVYFDVSRTLAGNMAACELVYRRQPLNSCERSRLALPSPAKLNFDDGADSGEEYNTKQASKSVVTEPASTDEVGIHEEDDQIRKRKMVIDSDEKGDCGVGALESDTSRLSIHDSIDDPKVDVSDKTGGATKRIRRSMIARLMDQSVATLDSPKIEKEWSAMSRLQEAVRQRVSLASSCSSTHSEEPLHVVAERKRQELVAGYLPKRKIGMLRLRCFSVTY
uniref:Uncharacterized protein n=1 Tax=Parascaris univalens TaxID=6257 RepID=A0A915A4N0_PARUN